MSKLITPVNLTNAPTASKPILEGVLKKFGMIPNMMGNFANHPEALKAYLALGDFFEASGLTPLEQQVVALTVSRENNCEYCMAAHSAISAMTKLDENTIQQLRDGEKLTDKKLEALKTFTKRMVSAKGVIDPYDVQDFLAAGYSKEHVLSVIIGITTKILANYTNHIVDTDIDEAFKPFAWSR